MISGVNVLDFRNFRKKSFKFSPKTNIIIGPNASGKTNILESVFLLSTGKSFRVKIEEEMVAHNSEIARVKGLIKNEKTEDKTNLEVVLTRGEINIGTARMEKVARKRLLVNGAPKRLFNFAGNLKVVLFGPWDLDLVTESPSLRRRFLDTVLSQTDREYRRSILSYEKGLRQRNKLLYRIREEGLSRSQLLFWDKLLIRNGDYISRKREKFIDFANDREALNDQIFSLLYDKSAISEGRLGQYAEEEVAAATTLVGPHRDDFIFKIKNKRLKTKNGKERNLARYGSRGEQRMGVLWLKLVELGFIEDRVNEKPTLLLDDIFSELDRKHRKIVMKLVDQQQTLITTASRHFIKEFKGVEKIELGG